MYELKIEVSYLNEIKVKFKTFKEVSNFLKYLSDGTDQAVNVSISRITEEVRVDE